MNGGVAKIGDKVVIDPKYRIRREGIEFYKKGRVATIVSFDFEVSFGPGNDLGLSPGIYVDTHWITVKIGDNPTMIWPEKILKLKNEKGYRRRLRNFHRKKISQQLRFIRDLPRVGFKENDRVKILPASIKKICLDDVVYPEDIFIIQRINYHLVQCRLNNEPWPIYQITEEEFPGGIYSAGEKDLILIE